MEDSMKRRNVADEMEQLRQQGQASLPRELLAFVVGSKKYWLIPILLVVGLLGILALLTSTGAAPFIYTLF